MMKRRFWSVFCVVLVWGLLMSSGVAYAQDGPGGVGGTGGSSDLLTWLRAEDLVLNDGDFVNTWPDASGNGDYDLGVFGVGQESAATERRTGRATRK
ncbi:MAG: hypothetical protein BRD55_01780 [Bacteroidetes bacterium SW_9_63_38]|nr:MAG: hypothetical protein BRD55_01780 [Bacteroidetes bacterium SW_9_63_38]